MNENKHGFEPKQEFTMGGINWTVIQTGTDWVKCIASECVEKRAFDTENKNDFSISPLRYYLNGEFLRRLIQAGAPEEMFMNFSIDLTTDDGLNNYGSDCVRIGLITCDEYRLLRGNIPALPDRWWWTATADSPTNPYVRYVDPSGTLSWDDACDCNFGVRPICRLKSELLISYLKQNNPKKTRLDDFFEKHPNAPVSGKGLPFVLPHLLGYCQADNCDDCLRLHGVWELKDCWNQEVEDDG